MQNAYQRQAKQIKGKHVQRVTLTHGCQQGNWCFFQNFFACRESKMFKKYKKVWQIWKFYFNLQVVLLLSELGGTSSPNPLSASSHP